MQENQTPEIEPEVSEAETPEIATPEPILKFGVFDDEGRPTAFYSSDVNLFIPDDAVEITDEQWGEFLDNPGTRAFKKGEVIAVAAPVTPPTIEFIRSRRNKLLAASDWTQLADSPLSTAKKAEWAAYRQALRDITESGDIDEIEWPTQP